MADIIFPGATDDDGNACYTPPSEAQITPFTPTKIEEEDLRPGDANAGGRVLAVTPKGNAAICAGQYGQWQVLQGLGGQITRGLYIGTGAYFDPDADTHHKVRMPVDCTDTIAPGEQAMAIRDRGRWYVMRGGAAPTTPIVTIGGGNVVSPAGCAITIQGLAVPSAAIDELPSAVPPLAGATADGLTWATSNGSPVWISNWLEDSGGTEHAGYMLPVVQGVSVYASSKYQVSVAGGEGETAFCYLVLG